MLFEHTGDNRSGKTFLMSLWGFFDWVAGRRVYANCRQDKGFLGGFDCFINYPHYHYDPTNLYYMPELHDCTVLTDESGEYMDSRKSGADEVIEIGNFGKQATKQDVDWHWDTVYHDEIEKRIRRKWHYQINSVRVPLNPKKPLLFIRVESRNRYNPKFHKGYFPNPSWNVPIEVFFAIYNDKATIRRRQLEGYA
jgi:hypothetical protein